MKSFLSIKPGATFFLGSSQTLVYHKDSIEVIYRYQSGKKSFYTHVYMYIVDDTKVPIGVITKLNRTFGAILAIKMYDYGKRQ